MLWKRRFRIVLPVFVHSLVTEVTGGDFAIYNYLDTYIYIIYVKLDTL